MPISYKKLYQFIFLFTSSFPIFSQSTFEDKFSKLYDYSIVKINNDLFNEYYEITINQSLDHSNPKKTFNQRIYFAFQDYNAPTLINTDGYSIGQASSLNHYSELADKLKANLLIVEHRFFGQSVPDSLDWKMLTVKQAAEDYHFIKTLFDKILTGKWISIGISKGGQAALAYKMYYPDDVAATVVYGTAVKDKSTVMTDSLLFNLSHTICGKKITALQSYLFRHKKELVPYFNDHVFRNDYSFTPLDNETVFDYLLLELPFSFWQNGNKCENIPDTTETEFALVSYLTQVVPARFFSSKNTAQLQPSFYMFYHELGYYEYNIEPFKKYLKQKDYSNKYFAPKGISIRFDNTYHKALIEFMKNNSSENIFFIYGQNDPWAMQTIMKRNVFIVSGGSHKSRIADLSAEDRDLIYDKIRKCIN